MSSLPPLLIEVDGRTLRFEGSRVVRIGRSIDADVVLTPGSVSRQHAELRPDGDGWVLVDSGSSFGTFVDGRRVADLRITGPATVQCGPEEIACCVVTLERQPLAGTDAEPPDPGSARPVSPAPPPPAQHTAVRDDDTAAGPALASAPDPAWEDTQVIGAVTDDGPDAAPRSGPDLLVVAEGREHRYRHPAEVAVGRQPDCGIVISDPSCSRRHGTISAEPGRWVFTNTSREGTFTGGRRSDRIVFDERTVVRLGHPVAGPELVLLPVLSAAEEERRIARRRRTRAVLGAVSVAAVLVLVAGAVAAAVVVTRDDDAGRSAGNSVSLPASSTPTVSPSPDDGWVPMPTLESLSQQELEHAKAATVLLQGIKDGVEIYSGSGSILTPQGLILTNAHVARPTADGLAEYYGDDDTPDPDYLLVSLVDPDDDSPAEPEYRARTVEVDGHRDVAVVRIYADSSGNRIRRRTLTLPTMDIGDSDLMRSGDQITVLGFPSISESTRLSVTRGVISTFIDRPDLGPRSEIDTDARIAPGNSGGAAINNDAQIIGIPSALYGSEGSPVVSGRVRPINFVLDLIEKAEEED